MIDKVECRRKKHVLARVLTDDSGMRVMRYREAVQHRDGIQNQWATLSAPAIVDQVLAVGVVCPCGDAYTLDATALFHGKVSLWREDDAISESFGVSTDRKRQTGPVA